MPEDYVKASMDGFFLMPLEIVSNIEKLNESKGNKVIILDLIEKIGVITCPSIEHQKYFGTIQSEKIGTSEEITYQKKCLGCGGIIKN